jgi:ABC-type transporter Mla subunit MlaD
MSEELPPSQAGEHEAGDEVRATDADAWATACAEDLAAEKARRRTEQGAPPGSAAEELRRLVDTVADRLSGLQSPLLGAVAGPAAQQVVKQVVQQAKAAVEPVIERNPDIFDHLAAAGNELLAAYRSAVQAQERRWTSRENDPRDLDEHPDDKGDEPGPGERIDLD